MKEEVHLCDPEAKNLTPAGYKKLILGRKRNSDMFKCGACRATFETICVLHAHCEKHAEGGSYFFDSFLRTAFPKYDTACAFTQVRPNNFDEVSDDCNVPNSGFENYSEESKSKVTPGMRKKPKGHKSKKVLPENKEVIGTEKEHDKLEHEKHEEKLVCSSVHSNDSNVRKSLRLASKKNRPSWAVEKRRHRKKKENDNSTCDETVPVSVSERQAIDFQPEVSVSVNNSFTDCKSVRKSESHVVAIKNLVSSSSDRANIGVKVEDSNDINPIDKTPDNALESVPESAYDTNEQSRLNKTSISQLMTSGLHGMDSRQAPEIEMLVESQDNQKDDELTASEVLLAMSKGGKDLVSDHSDAEHLSEQNQTTFIVPKEEEDETSTTEPVTNKRGKGMKASYGKQVQCKTCGKKGSYAMISYHKYIHREKRSFSCDKCGTLFSHPRNLQIHLRQHEEKQFICAVCQAAFHRKQYLEIHMRKHSGENPYMCDLCGKSYRNPNHLKRHIRHVHEKLRKFECDICLEKFFRSDHLKNHRLRHFEADKKCPLCKKMFKHPDDLLRHTKTHTGEKKWLCHLCNHGFVSVSPYYVHMARKHNIDREEAKVIKNKLQADYKKMLQTRQMNGETSTVNSKDETVGIVSCKMEEGLKVKTVSKYSAVPLRNAPKSGKQTMQDHTYKRDTQKVNLGMATKFVGIRNQKGENVNQSTSAGHQPISVGHNAGPKETGDQTLVYDKAEAALDLVHLQNPANIGEFEVDGRSVKDWKKTGSQVVVDKRGDTFFVYDDLSGAQKEHNSGAGEVNEGLNLNSGQYRVIQMVSVPGASSELMQQDRVIMETEESVISGLSETSGFQSMDVGEAENVVLRDGNELGLMIQVNNMDLTGENMPTVMFIDDNQCASEVVIDQLSTL